MEDALVLTDVNLRRKIIAPVLILVLMEDALVQYTIILCKVFVTSLNPCFNGRCTRTNGCQSQPLLTA